MHLTLVDECEEHVTYAFHNGEYSVCLPRKCFGENENPRAMHCEQVHKKCLSKLKKRYEVVMRALC